jgi:phage head maturation protease
MSDAPAGVALDAATLENKTARETAEKMPGVRALTPALAAVALRADEESEGGEGRTLFGHFARFNEWTEINSIWEGRFMERVMPGAFKKTFRDNLAGMRILLQHGRDPMMGQKPIAEPQVLREDGDGAYYEARLFDGLPEFIIDGIRSGQYGASFQFEPMREEWVEEPGESDHNPLGLPERSLKELRVPEFGPVAWGAYPNATASVRSLTDELVFAWIAREPQRARELVGARDLSRAAFRAAHKQEPDSDAARERTSENEAADPQNAPSTIDAARERTSATERRDPRISGRYGLIEQHDQRPSWAL